MTIEVSAVTGVRQAGEGTFVLSFTSREISRSVRPGQFLNVKVDEGTDPLLRRPFSVYRVDGISVEIIFNIVGRGTAALQKKRSGDTLDVLGPLGVPFKTAGQDFATGVLIAGGLGVAPMPMVTAALKREDKQIMTLLGGRSAGYLVGEHLENLHVATDDGSRGHHGTVVQLAAAIFEAHPVLRPKIFACGPTPMLRAVADFARRNSVTCEVSLEGPMGCGIGICQGCPVEFAVGERKYALMCKDGPTFDIRAIKI